METLVQGILGILVLLGTSTCVARSPVNRVEGQIRPVAGIIGAQDPGDQPLAGDDLLVAPLIGEEFFRNECSA